MCRFLFGGGGEEGEDGVGWGGEEWEDFLHIFIFQPKILLLYRNYVMGESLPRR